MSTESSTHENLILRLNAGAESAAADLDDAYRARLCRLVECEMNRRYRRREDAEDVVQSAFRSFYRRNAEGAFRIGSSADLWRLLAAVTRRKVLKHLERLNAEIRNPGREECLDGDTLFDRAPAPEEAAIATDLIVQALAGLDETYAKVFDLRLQNCTEAEIATTLGCTRTSVATKLQRLRDRLGRLSKGGANG
jgi:RNA polymerase sigma-70 factor (ECF subfamily)